VLLGKKSERNPEKSSSSFWRWSIQDWLLPDLKNEPGGKEGSQWGNVEDWKEQNEILKLTK
jgi:hypothetical protein